MLYFLDSAIALGGDGTSWATAFKTLAEALASPNTTLHDHLIIRGNSNITSALTVNKFLEIKGLRIKRRENEWLPQFTRFHLASFGATGNYAGSPIISLTGNDLNFKLVSFLFNHNAGTIEAMIKQDATGAGASMDSCNIQVQVDGVVIKCVAGAGNFFVDNSSFVYFGGGAIGVPFIESYGNFVCNNCTFLLPIDKYIVNDDASGGLNKCTCFNNCMFVIIYNSGAAQDPWDPVGNNWISEIAAGDVTFNNCTYIGYDVAGTLVDLVAVKPAGVNIPKGAGVSDPHPRGVTKLNHEQSNLLKMVIDNYQETIALETNITVARNTILDNLDVD